MLSVAELLKAASGKLSSGKPDIMLTGISIDSRTSRPGEAFISIKGHNFNGHDFIGAAIKKGAKAIIFSTMSHELRTMNCRGVSFIKVEDTQKALGDIARYWRRKFSIPVIAITGSNGKTTTKEMVAHILSASHSVLKNEGTKNNQIGLPMTLLRINCGHDFVVTEAGTNHPGEIDYLGHIAQPNVAIITNIGPSHLEYLRDLKGVFREKYKLIENLSRPYACVLNADDPLLSREVFKEKKNPFTISYAIRDKADFSAGNIRSVGGVLRFRVNKKYGFTLGTLGYYNIYNALAAIATARLFGIGYKEIITRLADFDFPQSRLTLTRSKETTFIDDTYNANPLSLEQALAALAGFKNKGRKIFVMGDMLELGSKKHLFHHQAGLKLAGACDVFIAVGKLSEGAAKAAELSGFNRKNIFTCSCAKDARAILFNRIGPTAKDVVLVKGSRSMKMEEVIR